MSFELREHSNLPLLQKTPDHGLLELNRSTWWGITSLHPTPNFALVDGVRSHGLIPFDDNNMRASKRCFFFGKMNSCGARILFTDMCNVCIYHSLVDGRSPYLADGSICEVSSTQSGYAHACTPHRFSPRNEFSARSVDQSWNDQCLCFCRLRSIGVATLYQLAAPLSLARLRGQRCRPQSFVRGNHSGPRRPSSRGAPSSRFAVQQGNVRSGRCQEDVSSNRKNETSFCRMKTNQITLH